MAAVLCLVVIISMAVPALASASALSGPSATYGDPNLLSPAAQSSGSSNISQIKDFTGLSGRLASIGTTVLYLLTALAVVYIVWTTVQYFVKGQKGDENRRAAGLQILWGIIGLFIILSLWGLVNILLNTFGTNTTIDMKNKLPQSDFVNK